MNKIRKRVRAPRAPAPWRVQRKHAGVYTVVDRNGIGVISSHQVAQSNAWLIAAAPDLLAACKAAADLRGFRVGCAPHDKGGQQQRKDDIEILLDRDGPAMRPTHPFG